VLLGDANECRIALQEIVGENEEGHDDSEGK
jgi:hypothetical protein